MRSEFEKTKTFKSIYSTLMYFDEDLNIYASNNKLREEDAVRLTYAWWGYQEQQSKVDELERIIKLRDQQLTEEIGLSTKYVAKSDELQKRVDAVKQLIQVYHQYSYREADDFVFYLEQALIGDKA